MPSFGAQMRAARQARGLSLAGLAELLPADKGHLSRIENGHRRPGEDLARRVDEVLGTRGELITCAALDVSAALDARPWETAELLHRMRAGAEATRIAARQLGDEAGHTGITGWSWEMAAWFALTQSRHGAVLAASRAGQLAAGRQGVTVQLIAQEAKALARLGDAPAVREALDRGRQLLDALPAPDRPDNHFEVDPDKWLFYAMDAYRLASDDAPAEHYATEVIRTGTSPNGVERSPMRVAEARLTLAATAVRSGDLERAVDSGLAAFTAARRSLPSLLLVAGEVDAELHRRYPREHATQDFREALNALR
ncbi:helix-turn-helix transcriptional regulator [Micromonospora sp. NPDC049230]|uniref:helix-turn-helix domain-containing protein n=1 Tax=Micromonospora sp. NPDC049230 TaxID=3155502 RepID=UPI0033C7A76E